MRCDVRCGSMRGETVIAGILSQSLALAPDSLELARTRSYAEMVIIEMAGFFCRCSFIIMLEGRVTCRVTRH